jgi:hypothetical protein
MNTKFFAKIGPVAGLIATLSTTSVAGYKIFAAAPHHQVTANVNASVSPMPSPTEEAPEEIVETVVLSPTPTIAQPVTPVVLPKVAIGAGIHTSASVTPTVTPMPTVGAVATRGDDAHESEHETSDDHANVSASEHISITTRTHETSEPTE